MGRGNGWRDAGDRRPHARVLAVAARRARSSSRSCRPPPARCASAFGDATGRSTCSPPSVSGDPRVGGTLTCDRGTWDDTAARPTSTGTTGCATSTARSTARRPPPTSSPPPTPGSPLVCEVHARQRPRGRATRRPTPLAAPRAREPQRAAAQRRRADRRRAALHARRLGRPRPARRTRRRSPGRATASRSRAPRPTATRVTAADLGARAGLQGDRRGRGERRQRRQLPAGRRCNRVLPDARRRSARSAASSTCSRGGWDDEGRTAYAVDVSVAARRRADRARDAGELHASALAGRRPRADAAASPPRA